MNGHLCRCGTYRRMMKAIQLASDPDDGRTRNDRAARRSDRSRGATCSRAAPSSWVSASRAWRFRSVAAAPGDVAGPPDPNAVDSWIAIHADNTATLFLGKIEMGQGNTTGLMQIAGEELELDISQMRRCGSTPTSRRNRARPRRVRRSIAAARRCGPPRRRRARRCWRAPPCGSAFRPAASRIARGRVDRRRTGPLGDLWRASRRQAVQDKFTGTAPQKLRANTGSSAPMSPASTFRTSARAVHAHAARAAARHAPRACRAAARAARVRRACQTARHRRTLDQADIPGARVVRKGDFVGVVAEREWDAIKAAAALKVTWEPTPALPVRRCLCGDARGKDDTTR